MRATLHPFAHPRVILIIVVPVAFNRSCKLSSRVLSSYFLGFLSLFLLLFFFVIIGP